MPAASSSRRRRRPKGDAPTDTLSAAQSIARYPWYQPQARLRVARHSSIRCRKGKIMRAVPYMPYLELRAQRLGAAAQVRRRRLSRGRQGHVRQRGQPLGRQQFHRRLAGPGHLVARQLRQVRPERSPALADHDRLFRRRVRRRHLRCGRRCQRQCLAHQLRRQGDLEVRQERQVAGGSGRHHLQRPARTDAGRDRHTEQRCLGLGPLEGPARPLPEGRPDQGPDRLRRQDGRALQVVRRAVPSRHRPAGPDLGDQRASVRTSRASRHPTRPRSRNSRPVTAAAVSRSTARATSG